MSVLVQVHDLQFGYYNRGRSVTILNSINLDVYAGETLGIVGESGCGKTTLGRCIVRLLKPASGQIIFEERDIARLSTAQLRPLRKEMQLVFQNPFTALDPRMQVLDLVSEPLITHTPMHGDERRKRVIALLNEVGLEEDQLDRYPHQLSGGEAQRVSLARALALNPRLLVLDEPTSALDVSVQAQIINLLLALQQKLGLTYLFISHNLELIQHISDRIAVMYLGEIVEIGSSQTIFAHPSHPYTEALLTSTPIPDPESGRQRFVLEGTVPSIADPPAGCRFHTRCVHAMDICRLTAPTPHILAPDHMAACHLLD